MEMSATIALKPMPVASINRSREHGRAHDVVAVVARWLSREEKFLDVLALRSDGRLSHCGAVTPIPLDGAVALESAQRGRISIRLALCSCITPDREEQRDE